MAGRIKDKTARNGIRLQEMKDKLPRHLITVDKRLKCFLVMAFIFFSCQEDIAYFVFHPVPEGNWIKRDTLTFELPDSLPGGCYVLDVGVRHNEAYPYRDLWLNVISHTQDSFSSSNRQVHLYLAEESGKWKGRGISGLHQLVVDGMDTVWVGKTIPQKQVRVSHIMKEGVLKGITDVGIRLRALEAAPSGIDPQENEE